MAKVQLNILLSPDVAERLKQIATDQGLKPSVLAARVIETADANGDYDIAKSSEYRCPFSRDRLHELRFREGKTLAEIANMAQEIEAWAVPPRAGTVRLWIETFGMAAGRDRLPPVVRTPRNRVRPELPDGQKQCGKCLSIKPVSEFYRDSTRPDGVRNICRTCDTARRDPAKMREWYLRNREKHIAKVRQARAEREGSPET